MVRVLNENASFQYDAFGNQGKVLARDDNGQWLRVAKPNFPEVAPNWKSYAWLDGKVVAVVYQTKLITRHGIKYLSKFFVPATTDIRSMGPPQEIPPKWNDSQYNQAFDLLKGKTLSRTKRIYYWIRNKLL